MSFWVQIIFGTAKIQIFYFSNEKEKILSYFEKKNTLNSQAFKQSSERKSLLKHLTLINISDIVGGPLKNWCCFTVWQFLRRRSQNRKVDLGQYLSILHSFAAAYSLLSALLLSWLQNLSSHMNHNHYYTYHQKRKFKKLKQNIFIKENCYLCVKFYTVQFPICLRILMNYLFKIRGWLIYKVTTKGSKLCQKSIFCPKIQLDEKLSLLGWLTFYRLGWVGFYRYTKYKIINMFWQNLLSRQKLDF